MYFYDLTLCYIIIQYVTYRNVSHIEGLTDAKGIELT